MDNALDHIGGNTLLAPDMWTIIANLVHVCPEARDYIFEYPNFVDGFLSAIKDANLFSRIFSGSFTWRTITKSEDAIRAMWELALKCMLRVFPEPELEARLPECSIMVEHLLNGYHDFFERVDAKLLVSLLSQRDHRNIIPFFVRMLPRLKDPHKKCLVLTILNAASRITMSGKSVLCVLAAEAGAVHATRELLSMSSDRLVKEALMWLYLYAQIGMESVEAIQVAECFSLICNIIEDKNRAALVLGCANVLLACCMNCVQGGERGALTLQFIIEKTPMIKATVSCCALPGMNDTTFRILTAWTALIKWNASLALNHLSHHDAYDAIHKLTAHPDGRIHALAYNLQDAMDALDEEETTLMTIDSDTRGGPYEF